MANIAVVGAGPMGLAATHELLKLGYEVTLYEADTVVGGMSASFDFAGTPIERFYHFICKTDDPYFEALKELGVYDKLKWIPTRMGYFHDDQLKNWGDPIALLTFRKVGLIARLRYGLMAFFSSKRRNWRPLDDVRADDWIKRWVGREAWEVFWKQLFEQKFYHFSDNLSAAWIWARIRRIGNSRKNLFTEQLGYLEGGTDTYLHAVQAAIEARGGSVRVNARVDEVLVEDGRARGVRVGESVHAHDAVISTVPLPFVADMIPALPETHKAGYRSVDNIAVVCVLAKLKRPFTPYFWLNISDSSFGIPGIIEYSNLNPLDETILYVPYYMPQDHENYQQSNAWFYARSREYLQRIDPELRDDDIITMSAGRYEYAQPICPPSFMDKLPPLCPDIDNLLVADTSYYYPEDRGVSESIQLGNQLAERIDGMLTR